MSETRKEESEEDRSPKAIKSEDSYEVATLTDEQSQLIYLVKEAFFSAINDVKQQPNNVSDKL